MSSLRITVSSILGHQILQDRCAIFFSIYYNLSWLKHTDHHSGPRTQKLLAEAKAANNHQLMRLLGVDEQLQPRCNSGFLSADKERWEQWAAADRAAIKEV